MSFEKECLDAHNKYRLQHGVLPLKLNHKISADCKKFAETLVREDALRNGNVEGLGENVFSVQSSNPDFTITGDRAADHWYTKASTHDYSQEPSGNSLPTGNFSQLVWKNSQELGVGYAKKNGKIVVVARYSPQGNIIGRFRENVFPLTPCAAPPAPTTASGIGNAIPFNTACLQAHNQFRAQHGVPSLSLDDNLCRYSQEWANELANRERMEHRQQSEYGENIFSAWSSDPNYSVDGDKAVDAWYDEIKYYKFGKEPRDLKAGHFTQVVWKGSQKLGVGVAKRNGHIYVVCNYSPPGNYVGNYTANVPALL